jgi:NADH/F420H2 dehydrogenase subunit C
MNASSLSFTNSILSKLPATFSSVTIVNDHLTFLTNKTNFPTALQFFKKHINAQYELLIDITAVDYLEPSHSRFEIVYQFLSLRFNHRITLKFFAKSLSMVPSSTFLYKSAGWLEREVWDLFGIFFLEHPDLRRILTDYGFQGFPLRKDFPLSGYTELRYDEEGKSIVYESLELAQEFRCYDFMSPWIPVF